MFPERTPVIMTAYEIFDTLLDDPMIIGSEFKEEKMDLLSTSMQESGLFGEQNEVRVIRRIWSPASLVELQILAFVDQFFISYGVDHLIQAKSTLVVKVGNRRAYIPLVK